MSHTFAIGVVAAALAFGPVAPIAAAQGKPVAVKVKGPKAAPGPKAGATPKTTAGPKATTAGPKTTHKPKPTPGPKVMPPGQAKKTVTPAPVPVAAPVPLVLMPAPVPKNPKLVAKLQALLPPGLTVQQAATGFRNQGQFVAAVHVSHNLGIPFVDLKTKMVTEGLSLGQSIQALRPRANGPAEATRAQRRAANDIR